MKPHEESALRAMHQDGKSVSEMSRVCKVTCEPIERRLRSIGLPAQGGKPRKPPVNYVVDRGKQRERARADITTWPEATERQDSRADRLLRRFSWEKEPCARRSEGSWLTQ